VRPPPLRDWPARAFLNSSAEQAGSRATLLMVARRATSRIIRTEAPPPVTRNLPVCVQLFIPSFSTCNSSLSIPKSARAALRARQCFTMVCALRYECPVEGAELRFAPEAKVGIGCCGSRCESIGGASRRSPVRWSAEASAHFLLPQVKQWVLLYLRTSRMPYPLMRANLQFCTFARLRTLPASLFPAETLVSFFRSRRHRQKRRLIC
jgi:hypothetical protein